MASFIGWQLSLTLILGLRIEAPLGMSAPLGTAKVLLRIPHFLLARRADAERFVLPELDLGSAERAGGRENVFRLPIPHVLAWATAFHKLYGYRVTWFSVAYMPKGGTLRTM
jgi:hypothetical protein